MASTGSLLECVSSKAETTVCLANAKSIFSNPVFFNPPSLSLSLSALSQWASVKGGFAEVLSCLHSQFQCPKLKYGFA